MLFRTDKLSKAISNNQKYLMLSRLNKSSEDIFYATVTDSDGTEHTETVFNAAGYSAALSSYNAKKQTCQTAIQVGKNELKAAKEEYAVLLREKYGRYTSKELFIQLNNIKNIDEICKLISL